MTEKSVACATCGTRFRTVLRASLLSLAFPGGGLAYVGHPVLAALDFLGELVVFGLFFLLLAGAAGPAQRIQAVLVGLVMLVLTKLESLHVGQILARRTIPEGPSRARLWKKLAVSGATVSVAAIAGAFFLARALGVGVDRDLDFVASGWTGSRVASEWDSAFADDENVRSRWVRDDDFAVFVFAYPLDLGQTAEEFWRDLRQNGGGEIIAERASWSSFIGYRYAVRAEDSHGTPLVVLHYFVIDPEGKDVHDVLTVASPEAIDEAEESLRSLLSGAHWIEATPPTHS